MMLRQIVFVAVCAAVYVATAAGAQSTYYTLTDPVQDPRLQFPIAQLQGFGDVADSSATLQNTVVNNFLDTFPNWNNLQTFSMTGDYENNRAFLCLGLEDRTVVREVDLSSGRYGDVMKIGELYFRNAPRIFWREDREELWALQPVDVFNNNEADEDEDDDDGNHYVHVGRLDRNLKIGSTADTYYLSIRAGSQIYWDEEEKFIVTANKRRVSVINVNGNVARTWRYGVESDNVYSLATAYDPVTHSLYIANMYFLNAPGSDPVGGVRIYVANPSDPIPKSPVAEVPLTPFTPATTNPGVAGRQGLGGATLVREADGVTFTFLLTNGDIVAPAGVNFYHFTFGVSGDGTPVQTQTEASGIRNILQSSNTIPSGRVRSISVEWTQKNTGYTSEEVPATPSTEFYDDSRIQ